MHSNTTINRSQSRKHYHEQSMDDFMKNIKKFNLRSERYISPKPLLYMYGRNNTTNTIEKSRSRTLSNQRSQSKSKRSRKSKKDRDNKEKEKERGKSSSKTIRSKLEKIFKDKGEIAVRQHENPATFIQKCGQKLKKAQKYLQTKSSIGHYLCTEFLSTLNSIIENLVSQLNSQLDSIQLKTQHQLQRKYTQKIHSLQYKLKKMDRIIKEMAQKAENNSRLVYGLRLGNNIDLDYVFGKLVLGTQMCGGQGYGGSRSISGYESRREHEEEEYRNGHGHQLEQFHRQFPVQPITKITKQKTVYSEFKLQLSVNNEFIEQKESGRIRQAYDWQREAYDDRQRGRGQDRLVTEMEEEAEEEEGEEQRERGRGREGRRST